MSADPDDRWLLARDTAMSADGLPRKRPHEMFSVRAGATSIHLGLGEHRAPDGRPNGLLREISIDLHKEGSPVRQLYHLISQLSSIAMRHGVPARTIVKAFRSVVYEPLKVEDHDTVKEARSVIDCIGQVIEAEYPNGKRAGQ